MSVTYAMPTTGMALRSHLCIEGIAVDDVLQEVFDKAEMDSRRRGVSLHFDVITWKEIFVAADRSALIRALGDIVCHVINSTSESSVTLTACPTHDDAGVMFEISNSTPARRHSDLVAGLFHATTYAHKCLEGMGSHVTEYGNAQGGSRVIIVIPQWV